MPLGEFPGVARSRLRPVYLKEGNVYTWQEWEVPEGGLEGWFHCWAGTSENAYALIEIPGGFVIRANNDRFRFTDVLEKVT